MIPIKKGQEPKELREYRCRPGAEYDGMPAEAKEALRALPGNRLTVLRVIQNRLRRNKDSGFKRDCAKYLAFLRENPTPFCGMALEWLQEKAAT